MAICEEAGEKFVVKCGPSLSMQVMQSVHPDRVQLPNEEERAAYSLDTTLEEKLAPVAHGPGQAETAGSSGSCGS